MRFGEPKADFRAIDRRKRHSYNGVNYSRQSAAGGCMSDFTLNVDGVATAALSDMNLPFPAPIAQLLPTTATDDWTPYGERYPGTFDIDARCCGLIPQCV